MKRNTFIFLMSLVVFINCKSSNDNVEIKTKTYLLKIIDSAQTEQSKKVLKDVYSQLQDKEFVLSLEKNDWQGIVPYNEEVELSDLSDYYPVMHKFKLLKDGSNDQDYNVKIELVYNKKLVDNIPNFDTNMYLRNAKDNKWQRFKYSGNFRFNEEFYKEDEQAEWIKRTIVLLTFK